MHEPFRKALAFVCWRLRAICGAPKDGAADWKVLGIVASLGLGLLLAVFFFASVLIHCRLLTDVTYWALIAPMAIALLLGRPGPVHLRALLRPYQAEFEKYSTTQRLLGSALVLASILGVAILMLQAADSARRLPEISCFQLMKQE
jgi:hypothetical protein